MKRSICFAFFLLFVIVMLPGMSFGSQSALSHVPVTYPGDTDKTVARRAQWIEVAKKEGALVWWGNLTPDEGRKVVAEFNKIYPFIAVTYWRAKGEEMGPKLESEFASRRFTVDVTLGGGAEHYARWWKMGMIEKFTDIIPGIEKMDKRMYSKYGYFAVPGNHVITPQYNTKLVSAAEAPKSWEDLLDPKWKGKIGLTTDMEPWIVFSLVEGGWGMAKTEEYLKKLKQQQLIWATGHTAGHQLLIAGEFKILGDGYLYHVLQSRKKDAPVEWCNMSPLPVIGSGFTFRNNSPHPNAAKLFLEWVLSTQGLVTFENITSLGSAFPGSGTKQSKMLEGIKLYIRTEEMQYKRVELGLDKKFGSILGVTPE